MDTTHIFELAQSYQHDPEHLHASLLACLPPDPQQPLAMGWPSSRVCVQLLEAALADFHAPNQSLVIATAMTELLNWSTLRAAAAADKPHAQTPAFKDCVRAAVGPVVSVRGDGNCFYRAVVKALFAPVALPENLEGALSLFLREQMNPATEAAAAVGGVEGAVERGVNDAETMSRNGTWADSVQIFKAANYLRCPIFVVTCADRGLLFDVVNNTALPSDSYCIQPRHNPEDDAPGGPGRAVDTPLYIHYDPYGHYETIVPKTLSAKYRETTSSLDAVLSATERLAGARPPTEDFIMVACWAYAMLYTALDNAQNESGDKTRQLCVVKRGIRRLANALARASAQETQRIAPAVLRLHSTLLSSMFVDNLLFIDGEDEPAAVGEGRLSELYKRLKKELQPHHPAHSQHAPAPRQSPTASSSSASQWQPQPQSMLQSLLPQYSQPPAQPWLQTQSLQLPQPQPHPPQYSQSLPQPQPPLGSQLPLYSQLPQLAPVAPLAQTQYYFMPVGVNMAPQNGLISAKDTDLSKWKSFRLPGNTVQFTNVAVFTPSLASFVNLIRGTRVAHVEFFYCAFDDAAGEALARLAALPSISTVTLTGCRNVPRYFSAKISER